MPFGSFNPIHIGRHIMNQYGASSDRLSIPNYSVLPLRVVLPSSEFHRGRPMCLSYLSDFTDFFSFNRSSSQFRIVLHYNRLRGRRSLRRRNVRCLGCHWGAPGGLIWLGLMSLHGRGINRLFQFPLVLLGLVAQNGLLDLLPVGFLLLGLVIHISPELLGKDSGSVRLLANHLAHHLLGD